MAIGGENQVGFGRSGMDEQYGGGLGEKVETEEGLAIAAQIAGNYDGRLLQIEPLPATTNSQQEN